MSAKPTHSSVTVLASAGGVNAEQQPLLDGPGYGSAGGGGGSSETTVNHGSSPRTKDTRRYGQGCAFIAALIFMFTVAFPWLKSHDVTSRFWEKVVLFLLGLLVIAVVFALRHLLVCLLEAQPSCAPARWLLHCSDACDDAYKVCIEKYKRFRRCGRA